MPGNAFFSPQKLKLTLVIISNANFIIILLGKYDNCLINMILLEFQIPIDLISLGIQILIHSSQS